MSEIKFNDSELQNLIKELVNKKMTVKVGILGQAASRTDGANNAEIGAAHEFGTKHLPQRSFLRVPLENRLGQEVNAMEYEKKVSIGKLAHKVGNAEVKIVQEAFMTEGFGEWPVSKTAEHDGKTLVDTAQLRDSINYEVSQ